MNEEEIKLRRKLIIRPIIYLAITIFIFVICMINLKRLFFFSFLIFNNSFIIPFAIFIAIILYVGVESYIFYAYNRKDKELAIKINDVVDIPRFIDFIIMISLFIVVFVITPCNVSGPSMENSLHDGNKILCSDLFYTPKYDDVVIFDSTNYADTKSELFVKRIVAVGGQKVEYNENKLYVDGNVVCDYISLTEYKRLYNSHMGVTESATYEYSYIMSNNKYIVLGDNRVVSYDSRRFGEIDRKDIYGHVLFRIYPFSQINKDVKN